MWSRPHTHWVFGTPQTLVCLNSNSSGCCACRRGTKGDLTERANSVNLDYVQALTGPALMVRLNSLHYVQTNTPQLIQIVQDRYVWSRTLGCVRAVCPSAWALLCDGFSVRQQQPAVEMHGNVLPVRGAPTSCSGDWHLRCPLHSSTLGELTKLS